MTGQARKSEPGAGKAAGGGSVRLALGGLAAIPALGLLWPTCLVLLIGAAPTLVAYTVDRTRDKSLTVTVGLLNVCGTLPGIVELWSRGQSYTAALRLAGDPFVWLIAYGAAAIGWGIYLMLPPLLSHYYAMATHARIVAYRRRQAQLVEAWGEEVAAKSDNE